MLSRRNFMKNIVASASAYAALSQIKPHLAMAMGKSAKLSNSSFSVPDTFDLADHAKLAINGMLGSVDTNRKDCEISFLNLLDTNPAYMCHWSGMVSGVQPKYIEALPLLRFMSGSDILKDVEKNFVNAMLENASQDGLVYDRASADRPWNVGVYYGKKDWNEDYANMAGNARFLVGLTYMYQFTKDENFKKLAHKTAQRLYELAIVDGNNAWYPNPGLGNDFSYPRVSGWTKKDPPAAGTEGFEGAAMFYHCNPLRGFTRYYQLTGDEKYLDLSRKFANFIFKPGFWLDPGKWSKNASAMDTQGAFERGHFIGHFHGILAAVRSMLDYALVVNDRQIIDWSRDCYEYVRQMGVSRLGLFTGTGQGHGVWSFDTEGCTIADVIGLAVTLSDAGIGDYYDDIEQYAANGLISAQATDIRELQRVSLEGKSRPVDSDWGGAFDSRFAGNKGVLPGQEMHGDILHRTVGAFGHVISARYLTPMMMHCCTANCSQSIYYAWESILRSDGDIANVNMWLNRRSPYIDVFSFLPYQGDLLLNNKGLKTITVRKPAWAKQTQIKCSINGKLAQPLWQQNRMVFNGLTGNENILINATLDSYNRDYTLIPLNAQDKSAGKYHCCFRGNTAVTVNRLDAGDDTEDRNWYRIYRRQNMLNDKTPMKPVDNYVHNKKVINWQVI